jgi:hypothetical protein
LRGRIGIFHQFPEGARHLPGVLHDVVDLLGRIALVSINDRLGWNDGG